MANKKFSEFDLKTSASDVDFVVGYDGTDNVRITPTNLTGGGVAFGGHGNDPSKFNIKYGGDKDDEEIED